MTLQQIKSELARQTRKSYFRPNERIMQIFRASRPTDKEEPLVIDDLICGDCQKTFKDCICQPKMFLWKQREKEQKRLNEQYNTEFDKKHEINPDIGLRTD